MSRSRRRTAGAPRSWRTTAVRTFVTAILALLATCSTGSSASAHASLTWASPDVDSRANGSPQQLQLHFRLPAIPDERTTISVVTPSGRDLATGDALVTGLGVAQRLAPSSEAGWYRVSFEVGLYDGHLSKGEFRFEVAPREVSAWGRSLWLGGSIGTLLVLVVLGRARRRTAGRELMASIS